MPTPPPGILRAPTSLALILLAAIAAPPACAEDFSTAMDQFAGRIKLLLDDQHESEVALNQFTAPARLAANASSGIRKALEEGLKKRGISVKKGARLEITGEYREAEELDRTPAVRIKGRVVEQDTGRAVSDCEVKVDNLASIAALVGATVEVSPTPVPADRVQAFNEGIQKPTARVASTRISADRKSPFAIEILVGPASCRDDELRPRAPVVDEGQAYMNIRTNERYAIQLINDASFDVAVTLTIDGLSLFAFGDNPEYGYYIVSQHSRGLITGWYRTNEEAEQFIVTEYARSAAASKSLSPSPELGVITACFAAAWPANRQPPPDEPAGRSATATGRGPSTKTSFRRVERQIGKLRASISVRYNKERHPKDPPPPPGN